MYYYVGILINKKKQNFMSFFVFCFFSLVSSQYCLDAGYKSNTILGAGNTSVNKEPSPHGTYILAGR